MSDEVQPYFPELDADGNVVPWERLPGESTEEYAAFNQFILLGPSRTLKEAARKVGISVTTVRALNAKYSWQDRATAHDDTVERRARQKLEGGRLAMRERHAALAEVLARKGLERLLMLDPMEMTAKDTAYIIDLASKLERTARGEEPTKVEVTGAGGGPIEIASNMSSDERAAIMARVAAELAARAANQPQLEAVYEADIVEDEDNAGAA
jgi:hypothetical protein